MSVSKAVAAGMILLMIAGAAQGQKNQAPPIPALTREVVRLPAKAIRFDSLGAIVARQTGFIFSFNARKIDPGKLITPPRKPLTVQDLLLLLSSSHQLRYRVAGHYIIFQQGISDKQVDRKKPSVDAHWSPLAATALARPSSPVTRLPTAVTRNRDSVIRPSLVAGVPVRPDTLRGPGASPRLKTLPPQGTLLRSFRRRPPTLPVASASSPVSRREGRSGGGGGRFFSAAGLAADDVFYMSPTVQAGLPWLYLTAKWNTNFGINGFSYGMGSSFRLNDDWNAAVEVTMGPLSRSYTALSGSFADTLRNAISVKGSLTRLGLQAERPLGRRWLLRAGPVMNLLRTTYYHKDKPEALPQYYPPDTDIDRTYYLVKPLYTISNSYKDNTTSNNKIWLGMQLTLLYRIPFFKAD